MAVQPSIPSEYQLNLYEIALEMRDANLPGVFITRAVDMGCRYRGIADLMMMWSEAIDNDERVECIVDIQELLDDISASMTPSDAPPQEARGNEHIRRIRFDDLDAIAQDIMGFKNHLRLVVEQKMTLTELAKKTDMPLASISRFFNTPAMPRRATLLKIAAAVGLSELAITSQWSY